MKKIMLCLILLSMQFIVYSQASEQSYPSGYKCDNCLWGCPLPLKQIINESPLIFEGRVLFDSTFISPYGGSSIYHRVLVLKQFKGNFKSDTIQIMYLGGGMGYIPASEYFHQIHIYAGDEAVFLVGDPYPPGKNLDVYGVWGDGCGFVKVCDKKDVVKEVYEPIEAVTGQKYVDVHPNTCATQQKK